MSVTSQHCPVWGAICVPHTGHVRMGVELWVLYREANFATYVSKTLIFSPPKMDEFNFKRAQYCISKI